MSRPTTLLIAGLDITYFTHFNPGANATAMSTTLTKSMDTLNAVPNLHHQRFYLDPQASATAPNSIAAVKQLIKEGPPQGGRWDGLMVGGGVRMNSALTWLLEELVNEVQREGRGETKILFVEGAEKHWECVRRGFPGLGMGERPAV